MSGLVASSNSAYLPATARGVHVRHVVRSRRAVGLPNRVPVRVVEFPCSKVRVASQSWQAWQVV